MINLKNRDKCSIHDVTGKSTSPDGPRAILQEGHCLLGVHNDGGQVKVSNLAED